jgi:hypothetical protein
MFGFGILESLLAIAGPLLIGGLFVFFAVRRVRKNLDPANMPTKWQVINELGGYFVVGIVLVLYSLVAFVTWIVRLF